MNDLVFVKANHALRRRRKETIHPILLKDIDESNERLLGRMNGDSDDDTSVFEDDNLTWAGVDRACVGSVADEPTYHLDVKHPKEALLSKALLLQWIKERLPPLLLDLGDGFI